MQTFIIGRDAGNQIVLDDKLVSRHHAQLTVLDNGQVMIKDLGSSNGTFVNGNRVTETNLNAGDIVKCGPVFLNWIQYTQVAPKEKKTDILMVAGKADEWNNKFLSFINPFLGTIDNGSFFRRVFGVIYVVIAILNILVPFYILFKAIDIGIFKAEGKYVLTFLLLWCVLALLCWFSFQLWWNRRDKVNHSSYAGAEFVATPVVAHFIQTFGEWYGILTGVLGFLMGLLSLVFSGSNDYSHYYSRNPLDDIFSMPFLYGSGWSLIFLVR
ncbi:MAG: FHA domain-containing protein [Chitinophagaceae bacterium]|nr:FHA domain-containing protein [Chitinophagaceae bacterium]